MKSNDLKKLILSLEQDIEFTYNGKFGSICPFSANEISVAFDGNIKEYDNIDDVMQDKFFDGESLNEISELIIYG